MRTLRRNDHRVIGMVLRDGSAYLRETWMNDSANEPRPPPDATFATVQEARAWLWTMAHIGAVPCPDYERPKAPVNK